MTENGESKTQQGTPGNWWANVRGWVWPGQSRYGKVERFSIRYIGGRFTAEKIAGPYPESRLPGGSDKTPKEG